MNSALNLINPQRFHVLIPKVKGVIVLTNEVSVPPSGNKGKKEQNTESKGRDRGCYRLAFFLSDSPDEWRCDTVARGPTNRERSRLLFAQGRHMHLSITMCKGPNG